MSGAHLETRHGTFSRRRWRQCLLLVCGVAIAWDLAMSHWRGDGLARLSGAEKAAAQEVLDLLSVTCLDHPISYYLFARHWRVTSVRFMPRCPASYAPFGPYQVTVTISTFFGLPLQQVTQTCRGEILCYGWVQPNRRAGGGSIGDAAPAAGPTNGAAVPAGGC